MTDAPWRDSLHPAVADWLQQEVGEPTPVQRAAWPLIARGEHALAIAPTGSGKTLAALLVALDRLLTKQWPADQLAVVYVSPLRALGQDVQRNLLAPLAALQARLAEQGIDAANVRVAVRNGDTPQAERQAMAKRPPTILVTTPESLQLLLLYERQRRWLQTARLVVLDEIHAVAPTRRGALLMAGVEALDALVGGGLQRVAMSATLRPAEPVATFVAGRSWQDGRLVPRPIHVVAPPAHKVLELQVAAVPLPDDEPPQGQSWWALAAGYLLPRILERRSTLLFANSRAQAEKVAQHLNDQNGSVLAFPHHGSLSRPLRHEVEQRLKAGELKAVCATSSLELGIDIGALEEVILLGAPRSLASSLQRLGRAGHQVGAASRGLLVPVLPIDLLLGAVLAPAVEAGEVEPIRPQQGCLDVLAQVILAWCAAEPQQPEQLYNQLRQCAPFAELTPAAFDATLALLQGHYADTQLPVLQPRLRTLADGALALRPGVLRTLTLQGGVIPDRGYFRVRVAGSLTVLGELDEEFVWEQDIGQVLVLGAQAWQLVEVRKDDVVVAPAQSRSGVAPFWRADSEERGWPLSNKLLDFLTEVAPRLADADLPDWLQQRARMDEVAAAELGRWLRRQQTGAGLPTHKQMVLEHLHVSGRDSQYIWHTGWGGQVLRPFVLALAALAAERGERWQFAATDDCILLTPPQGAHDAEALVDAVLRCDIRQILTATLGQTNYFAARFRECASRALLLPKPLPGKRIPLWVTRQRAQGLLQEVAPYRDFPIVAETWRTCMEELFDLPVVELLQDRYVRGELVLQVARTLRPSPLAEGVVWLDTSEQMYAGDLAAPSGAPLHETVLRSVSRDAGLRPELPAGLVEALRARTLRTAPGWRPADAEDALDLLRDRLVLSEAEWQQALAGAAAESSLPLAEVERQLARRVAGFQPGLVPLVVATERLPHVDDPARRAAHLQQWWRGRGPLQRQQVAQIWGEAGLDAAMAQLVADGWLLGEVLVDSQPMLAPAADVERLLRGLREQRRAQVSVRPLPHLSLFRALWHGLVGRETAGGPDALLQRVDQLLGLPLPAGLWEDAVLPARFGDYTPQALDALQLQTDLLWTGADLPGDAIAPRGERRKPPLVQLVDRTTWPLLPEPRAPRPEGLPQGAVGADALLRQHAAADVGAASLWSLLRQGFLASDRISLLRQGLGNDFAPPEPPRPSRRPGLRLQSGPQGTLQPRPPPLADPLLAAEAELQRARLVLQRHGIVARPLLAHEPAGQQWRDVLPALRRLELSGECVVGQFFADLPGLQFALPEAIRTLGSLDESAETLWWCAPQDPACLCGLDVPLSLPSLAGTQRLVFCGAELVGVLRRKELTLHWPADHPRAAELAEALLERTKRAALGAESIEIDSVNSEPVSRHPWRAHLQSAGLSLDYRTLRYLGRFQ